MPERIGIVTGGGDCPGLDAVIRAVVKAASRRGWETVGFLGGYDGMLEPRRHRELRYEDMGGLLARGGPNALDRALCSMFGAEAVELIAAGAYGQMVTWHDGQVGSVALARAIGRLKTVPTTGGLAQTARALGISLGD